MIRAAAAQPGAAESGKAPPVASMFVSTDAPVHTPDEILAASDTMVTPAPATAAPTGAAGGAESFEEAVARGLSERWQGRQAIVARAEREDASIAELWLFEQDGNAWRKAAGPWPAVTGINGVCKQMEGDGRAPSGVFLLGTAFGNAPQPERSSYPYREPDRSDRWVDDPDSPFYNRWVRGGEPVCGGGEDLSGIWQYEYAVAVRYNDEAKNYRGSAIFLHVWSGAGKATRGCTAISREHMVRLLQWLDYGSRPVLIQGTDKQIGILMDRDWGIACLPQGWGYVDDFIPDAQLELRYHTQSNFTGYKLPGYQAPLAPMRMEAIQALAEAAARLRSDGIGIRVFDAYRPQQATDAMIEWAGDLSDTATKAEYYPGIDKADIPGRFVARRSAHRLGGTVDLTLLSWKTGKDMDMGGPFDFFGELSAFGYGGITSTQARNRALLRSAMTAVGFQPYDREWWHFSQLVDGEGGVMPILPREVTLH